MADTMITRQGLDARHCARRGAKIGFASSLKSGAKSVSDTASDATKSVYSGASSAVGTT
ncbi:MAG: hypothetical protein IPM41_07730 [Sphingomonadales bacterium]|nr:hypothetical protein [Sphingomonadales bacterium]